MAKRNRHGPRAALRRRLRRPIAIQLEIPPLGGDQLVVGALLGDLAVLEHHDPARLADRGEAVGDHDRGAAGEQAPEALLDARLGVEIDVRGRLVQDEDARVGDQGSGERDQLALAGRELGAALAYLGVVAVGELGDELLRADRRGR